jgi:hypothetical protein
VTWFERLGLCGQDSVDADCWRAEVLAVVTVEEDTRWLLPGLGPEVQDLVKQGGALGGKHLRNVRLFLERYRNLFSSL